MVFNLLGYLQSLIYICIYAYVHIKEHNYNTMVEKAPQKTFHEFVDEAAL